MQRMHSISAPARLSRRLALKVVLVGSVAVGSASLLVACQPSQPPAPQKPSAPAAPAAQAAATAAPAAKPVEAADKPVEAAAKPAAPTAAPATRTPVTITFATSANADSAEAVTLVSLFKDYEAKTPGVKIDLQPIPYDNFMQTLTTRVVGNQAPDAALLLDRFATALAGQKALLALDTLLPADYAKPFNDAAWKFAVVEGRPYAIPLYANVQAIIYNAEQFKKAGVTPPSRPEDAWQLEQVIDTAAKLKAANGTQFGMIHWPASTPARLSQYLVAAGGSVLNEDFSGPNLDTPTGLKVLGQIKASFDRELAPRDNWSHSNVQPEPMFGLWANAQAPMLLASGNFQIQNATRLVGDKFPWSFAFMPTTLGTPIELAAFNQTKAPEQTVALLRFLAEPASMARMAAKANLVPTRTDLPAGEPKYEAGAEQMAILQQQLSRASSRIQQEMMQPSWSEIDLMLRKELEALALGQKGPEQVAKDGSAEMVRILERYKQKPA